MTKKTNDNPKSEELITLKVLNRFFVQVKPKYQEGHVLTRAEAVALNQTHAENARNSIRAEVHRLHQQGEPADNIEKFIEDKYYSYDLNYAKMRGSLFTQELQKIAGKLTKEYLAEHPDADPNEVLKRFLDEEDTQRKATQRLREIQETAALSD